MEIVVRRGLFKAEDPYLGLCAHVAGNSGDAFPLLSRRMYELLGFEPAFGLLPTRSEYESRRERILAS